MAIASFLCGSLVTSSLKRDHVPDPMVEKNSTEIKAIRQDVAAVVAAIQIHSFNPSVKEALNSIKPKNVTPARNRSNEQD